MFICMYILFVTKSTCWLLPFNQSYQRQIAVYRRVVGDYREMKGGYAHKIAARLNWGVFDDATPIKVPQLLHVTVDVKYNTRTH